MRWLTHRIARFWHLTMHGGWEVYNLEPPITGWWLTYPSEKYEGQLGLLFPIYGKIKNVPNHQPENDQSWIPVQEMIIFRPVPAPSLDPIGCKVWQWESPQVLLWLCQIISRNVVAVMVTIHGKSNQKMDDHWGLPLKALNLRRPPYGESKFQHRMVNPLVFQPKSSQPSWFTSTL